MITSFLVIFFLWLILSQKKNTHQQTKLLIQGKHLYAYDTTFLCPPLPSPTKKYPIEYTLFFSLVDIFFAQKNVPTMLFSTGHFSFYFSFPFANRIFFNQFGLLVHFEIVKIMISF